MVQFPRHQRVFDLFSADSSRTPLRDLLCPLTVPSRSRICDCTRFPTFVDGWNQLNGSSKWTSTELFHHIRLIPIYPGNQNEKRQSR
ncbi:hypothetical protein PENTCL1PPCAC_26036, partial [Pristionchus entomophagus]